MKKQILAIFLIAVIVFSFGSFGSAPVALAATPDIIDYDYTSVLDDLASSTTGGVEFNVTDYPATTEGKLQFITFAEYAYSADAARRGHYGLYVYLYNPAGIEFLTTAPGHKIQLAVKHDAESKPTDYEKFDLKIVSISPSPYLNRFVKLKVIDHKSGDGKYIADRVNQHYRRYDISGFELIDKNATNATEYGIERSFVYSGFAAGYDKVASGTSTLTCDVRELETIPLKVNHTYFRTGLSALGNDHENQLDSVYFGVDNETLENYGRLQRVKAEWWEYKTKPIIVTSHMDAYNALAERIGADKGNLNYELYYNKQYISGGYWVGYYIWDWSYNPDASIFNGDTYPEEHKLYYLFYTPNIEAYDPRGAETVVGGASSNQLYQYIMQYDKSYELGTLPIKNGTISADLFTDSVDESRVPLFNELEAGRKNGYYVHDFDVDVDLHQMPSYNTTNPDFLQKVRDFGFLKTIWNDLPVLDDSYNNVSPIYQVSDVDLQGTDAEVSTQLLIRADDVPKFKTYYSAEKNAGREVFIFRYATTDYFSGNISINGNPGVWDDQAYMTQETVFLDFDIIQLTFNKAGEYTVIPVVNNPIDAVADLTPPAYIPEPPSINNILHKIGDGIADLFGVNMPEWLRITIAVVVGIILLVIIILLLPLLLPLFRAIFKGIWWFITLPVRAIKYMAKKTRERKARKKTVAKTNKTGQSTAPAPKPRKAKKIRLPRQKIKKQKTIKLQQTKPKRATKTTKLNANKL